MMGALLGTITEDGIDVVHAFDMKKEGSGFDTAFTKAQCENIREIRGHVSVVGFFSTVSLDDALPVFEAHRDIIKGPEPVYVRYDTSAPPSDRFLVTTVHEKRDVSVGKRPGPIEAIALEHSHLQSEGDATLAHARLTLESVRSMRAALVATAATLDRPDDMAPEALDALVSSLLSAKSPAFEVNPADDSRTVLMRVTAEMIGTTATMEAARAVLADVSTSQSNRQKAAEVRDSRRPRRGGPEDMGRWMM